MARKWGLFIVSKTWVTDSIEMEACADESLYKVREVRSINRDDSSSMDSHAGEYIVCWGTSFIE